MIEARPRRDDLLTAQHRHQKWAPQLAAVLADYAKELGVVVVPGTVFFSVPRGYWSHDHQDCCRVEMCGKWTPKEKGPQIGFSIQHYERPIDIVRDPGLISQWWTCSLGGMHDVGYLG